MVNFADGIIALQNMGVADVILPFLLIFTVVFAVFQKTKILGRKEEAKRYNVIVALVMGASVIFPHILGYYPPTSDPVIIINSSLPSIAVVVVAVIMVMLLLGVFGADIKIGGTGLTTIIMLFSFATVIYVFGTSAGFFGNGNFPAWLWFLADPNTQSLLVMILVFGGIIYFITKEDKKDDDKVPVNKWLKALGDEKDEHH